MSHLTSDDLKTILKAPHDRRKAIRQALLNLNYRRAMMELYGQPTRPTK